VQALHLTPCSFQCRLQLRNPLILFGAQQHCCLHLLLQLRIALILLLLSLLQYAEFSTGVSKCCCQLLLLLSLCLL
jgi:hypothetical protein